MDSDALYHERFRQALTRIGITGTQLEDAMVIFEDTLADYYNEVSEESATSAFNSGQREGYDTGFADGYGAPDEEIEQAFQEGYQEGLEDGEHATDRPQLRLANNYVN